jgi:hypothetical protein
VAAGHHSLRKGLADAVQSSGDGRERRTAGVEFAVEVRVQARPGDPGESNLGSAVEEVLAVGGHVGADRFEVVQSRVEPVSRLGRRVTAFAVEFVESLVDLVESSVDIGESLPNGCYGLALSLERPAELFALVAGCFATSQERSVQWRC